MKSWGLSHTFPIQPCLKTWAIHHHTCRTGLSKKRQGDQGYPNLWVDGTVRFISYFGCESDVNMQNNAVFRLVPKLGDNVVEAFCSVANWNEPKKLQMWCYTLASRLPALQIWPVMWGSGFESTTTSLPFACAFETTPQYHWAFGGNKESGRMGQYAGPRPMRQASQLASTPFASQRRWPCHINC